MLCITVAEELFNVDKYPHDDSESGAREISCTDRQGERDMRLHWYVSAHGTTESIAERKTCGAEGE